MTIEQEIFSSYKPDNAKLIAYGFSCFKDTYAYSKSFHNDEFIAKIVIDEKGIVKGKVIEKAFDEEYLQLRNDAYNGGFVGTIREDYRELLVDIRCNCFKKVLFVSPQANRLANLIKERYHEEPDYPFDNTKYKPYGVFRYQANQKWYGLIMHVNKAVLTKKENEEDVDILNVRIDETQRDKIINYKNIFPSYHMNKQKWFSIILDESLNDEEVMNYINFSREFMIKK